MPDGIDSLFLHHFRSYLDLAIHVSGENVVLFGENGAGKTNILEAVSLFAPGRGLRRARLSHMLCSYGALARWNLRAIMHQEGRLIDLATSGHITANKEKRVFQSFGKAEKTLGSLSRFTSISWITPQMDRLFSESSSTRRRFIDHMGIALFHDYAHKTSDYEDLITEWGQVKAICADAQWIEALETQMIELGIKLTESRLKLVYLLNDQIDKRSSAFPKGRIDLDGQLEKWVSNQPEKEVAEQYKAFLKTTALQEGVFTPPVGPHKTAISFIHKEKNIPAHLCSTGEQKALLLSIILAFAELMKEYSSGVPILLLDEAVAHLDSMRRECLFEEIRALKMQTWMTGTDVSSFKEAGSMARFFKVSPGVAEEVEVKRGFL